MLPTYRKEAILADVGRTEKSAAVLAVGNTSGRIPVGYILRPRGCISLMRWWMQYCLGSELSLGCRMVTRRFGQCLVRVARLDLCLPNTG